MPAIAAPKDTKALRTQVEERAYALWEKEGRPHGRALDHWRQAEAELMAGAGSKLAEPPPNPTASPAASPAASSAASPTASKKRTRARKANPADSAASDPASV